MVIVEARIGDCVSPATFSLAFCANTFQHSSENFIKIYSVFFIERASLQSHQTQKLVQAPIVVRPLHCICKRKFIFLPSDIVPMKMFGVAKMPILACVTGYEEEKNPFLFTVAHSKCSTYYLLNKWL